ncbi:MAG: SPASM domain-containing protein [Deltaproteobacteria bacterium]|nr:MAG: SPASM domain-containing protein [Deltaproteobacteria bacterium]
MHGTGLRRLGQLQRARPPLLVRGGRVNFSLPLRVRWDLDRKGTPFDAEKASAIFSELENTSPLLLEVTVETEDGLRFLSRRAGEGKIPGRVQVFLGDSVSPGGHPLPGTDVFFHLKSFTPEDRGRDRPLFWAEYDPGDPDRSLLLLLPLIEAGEEALVALRTVNLRKRDNLDPVPPFPDAGYLERFFPLSAGTPGRGPKLVVHDFFLWEFLSRSKPHLLEGRGEFGGCQGGVTLAYVDWEGSVYPCESYLVKLGNLLDKSMEEVWGSPEREEVASLVRRTPGKCGECRFYEGCRGGCRGLSHHFGGGADGADPQCPF